MNPIELQMKMIVFLFLLNSIAFAQTKAVQLTPILIPDTVATLTLSNMSIVPDSSVSFRVIITASSGRVVKDTTLSMCSSDYTNWDKTLQGILTYVFKRFPKLSVKQ